MTGNPPANRTLTRCGGNANFRPQTACGMTVEAGAVARVMPDVLYEAWIRKRSMLHGPSQTNPAMIRGNRRRVDALSGTPLEQHDIWIGDYR